MPQVIASYNQMPVYRIERIQPNPLYGLTSLRIFKRRSVNNEHIYTVAFNNCIQGNYPATDDGWLAANQRFDEVLPQLRKHEN